MGPERLELSAALSDNVRTRPLLDGTVAPDGVRLLPTRLHPSEMFWRQLRFGDFDVSEMSLSSLLIAVSRGDRRWAALPVYTMRRFFHTGIMVSSGAGIGTPADLRGKRVGVPEYQQTAAIWIRGILEDEFGVKPNEIEWHMERVPERSHGGATGFVPPPGVTVKQIPASTNIGRMLVAGELDAAIIYLRERNLVDRSDVDIASSGKIRPLFADPVAEGRRYFAKTGIYPINHTVVVRRELVERHPWLALNLYTAFVAAKEVGLGVAAEVLASYSDVGGSPFPADLVANDPMPYGFATTLPILRTVADYVYNQGLMQRRVKPEELFAESATGV